MDYLSFKQKFFELACFNNDQILAWYPAFDRNNLGRWTKKGLLDLLYLYPEYKSNQHMSDLRLNDDFLHEDMNKDLLDNYVTRLKTMRLSKGFKPYTMCMNYDTA